MSNEAQWWKSAVVYQIYPRSFADSNGDGVGDLEGVITKLDYLQTLGVDVIWLSPVYPSPQDDNGYDISNYQDIDPMFGTLDVFDELLNHVHERGMKLVMDLVVNHTSDEHPWFVESRSSKDNPKRDWYWWRDARDGQPSKTHGAEPTNWQSFFSGSTWQWEAATKQYYLHLFSVKQPDLNWENPEVRNAVYEMMRWWLDRGVDGFRMDVINVISKNTLLPDGPPIEGTNWGNGWPYFISGPRVHEYLQEMHDQVFAGCRDRLIIVGETPGVTIDEAIAFTDPNRNEVDMVFQFDHMAVDTDGTRLGGITFSPLALKQKLSAWQEGLADTGWNSLYWNNHDTPRVVSRFGDDAHFRIESAKMLATVLHLQRGTPYIYQGEELAMTNTTFATIDDVQDIEGRNAYQEAVTNGGDVDNVMAGIRRFGRDNARTPMQWDDTAHAGFTTGTPWLTTNDNYVDINAAAQVEDPDSVFSYYRQLIALRHQEPCVVHGDFTLLLPDHPYVFAFTRRLRSTELLVIGSFSNNSEELKIEEMDQWADAELALGNYANAPFLPSELRPWEARVYRRVR